MLPRVFSLSLMVRTFAHDSGNLKLTHIGLDEARYELAKIEKAITLEAATWYYIEECIKELIASGVLDERERTQWKQAISWSRTRNFLIKERRDSKQARKDAQTYLQEEFEAELDARLQMGGARKAVKLFEEQFVERMRNPRDNGGGLLVKELFMNFWMRR